MPDDAEVEALIRSFEDGSLPRSDWTHEKHLIVALWYLRRQPKDIATQLIREGIQRHNRMHGREAGYHETITLAWVAVVGGFLAARNPAQPIGELAVALLDDCGDKDFLLRYYSREVLLSHAARTSWVPPDRRPIESTR